MLFSSTFFRGYIIGTCGLWYKYRICDIMLSNKVEMGLHYILIVSLPHDWCLVYSILLCVAILPSIYYIFRCISFQFFLIHLQTWVKLCIIRIRIYYLMEKDLTHTLLFHLHLHQNDHSIFFV